MGNSPDTEKKTINQTGYIDQQSRIIAVLKEMTDGKYQQPGLLGATITGGHPYLFDTKGELSKVSSALSQAQKRLDELEKTLALLAELGCVDTLNDRIRTTSKSALLETAYDLIIENATRAGASNVLSDLAALLRAEVEAFQIEIESKRKELPAGKTKLKAAHIAKQIADIYAETLGQRPTAGSIGKGLGSTAYSKAVVEIFDILGVKGNAIDFARDTASRCTDEAAKAAYDAKLSKRPMRWF